MQLFLASCYPLTILYFVASPCVVCANGCVVSTEERFSVGIESVVEPPCVGVFDEVGLALVGTLRSTERKIILHTLGNFIE